VPIQELPMKKLIRLTFGLLCLGVLAMGITVSHHACPSHWDGGKRASLAEELGREANLKESFEVLRRQRQAKRQVAQEVIAQRRSLAQAIEQFRALDRDWPEGRLRFQTPQDFGMSEYEWDGRSVIYFVRQVLADRPGEATKVVGCLEKELHELLQARKKRHPAPADPRTEGSR
jgi:hypothetical protein